MFGKLTSSGSTFKSEIMFPGHYLFFCVSLVEAFHVVYDFSEQGGNHLPHLSSATSFIRYPCRNPGVHRLAVKG